MSCRQCGSDRIAGVNGHSKDLATFTFGGVEREGYLPDVFNVCNGDDIDIKVCLNCGQLQGTWPVDTPTFETMCRECEEDIELIFGEVDCPECGADLNQKRSTYEPRESAGACPVKVSSQRCQLLVAFDFEDLPYRPIGHEMIVSHQTETHVCVEYMGHKLDLELGTQAELI